MNKNRKTILHILVLLILLSPLASGEEKQREKYVSEIGNFDFALPDDWSIIPDSLLQTFNQGKPLIYQYQGGIIDDKSSTPQVYMLLQVKQRSAESKKNIDVYKKAAIKADDLSMIADVIVKKEYREKREFYSPKHGVFLMITGEPPQLSVMVKKFTNYGYFIMHFYVGKDSKKHLKDIEFVLSSIQESARKKDE